MFDITGGEVLVLLGAATILLGKRELPVVAKMAGKGLGRMVAVLNTAREQFAQFAGSTELSKLQDEVRQNMYELNSIRSEVRTAGMSRHPGTMGRTQPRMGTGTSTASSIAIEQHVPISATRAAAPVTTSGSVMVMSPQSSEKLSRLAMAELLLQEKDAQDGDLRSHRRSSRQSSGAVEGAGSDLLQDVIFETLMRDHVDRVARQDQQQQGGAVSIPKVP